jgi:hypothetical protein
MCEGEGNDLTDSENRFSLTFPSRLDLLDFVFSALVFLVLLVSALSSGLFFPHLGAVVAKSIRILYIILHLIIYA